MLIEDVRMCESLRRIVSGFSGDPALQQDMLQECMVCLWKIESEKPGRTRSWYLQNCRFHVQHWLAAGRSLDSHKRALGGNRVALHGTEEDGTLDGYHTNGELFEAVSVRDLVSTLAPLLKPAERRVLCGLADGFILREIASKTGISYPTALKYRRRIATLATRLGIYFPADSPQPNGNSVPPQDPATLPGPLEGENQSVPHESKLPLSAPKPAKVGGCEKIMVNGFTRIEKRRRRRCARQKNSVEAPGGRDGAGDAGRQRLAA